MSESTDGPPAEAKGPDQRRHRTRRLDRFRDLFDVLATRRNAVHANRMATHLLRYETATRELIALLDGAERAVFYTVGARSLVSVAFDKHGVDETSQELLLCELGDPDAWVEAYRAGVCWVR
jgi:hypothetical protein